MHVYLWEHGCKCLPEEGMGVGGVSVFHSVCVYVCEEETGLQIRVSSWSSALCWLNMGLMNRPLCRHQTLHQRLQSGGVNNRNPIAPLSPG